MEKKYEFYGLPHSMACDGRFVIVHRIRAVRDIEACGVRAGNLGGWVESEDNLDQEGDCWVADRAIVFGDARIKDNAYVGGEAAIYGNAIASGNAIIKNNAMIYEYAKVSGNATVIGYTHIHGESVVSDCATVGERAEIFQNAIVKDNAYVGGEAKVFGNVEVGGLAKVSGSVELDKKGRYLWGTFKKPCMTLIRLQQADTEEEIIVPEVFELERFIEGLW